MGKRYNASQEQGRMTHASAPPETRDLLSLLNVAYPPGNTDAIRYADRSSKKRHFRLVPGVADFFDAKTEDITDTSKPEGADPRTEFVQTHEFLEALTFYIRSREQAPVEIMTDLRGYFGSTVIPQVQTDMILRKELV